MNDNEINDKLDYIISLLKKNNKQHLINSETITTVIFYIAIYAIFAILFF